MKRLTTILVAAAFAAACVAPVEEAVQEEVGAEQTAFESEVDTERITIDPEGPGSCAGWTYEYAPGYVVVPVECLEGAKYYYMGDPWTWQQGE